MTYEELSALLSYDPLTGIFKWKITVSGRAKAGSIAGSISKVSGYVEIRIRGKLYYGHHLAWFFVKRCWAKRLDHKNNKRSENWINNLRLSNYAQNNQNTLIRKNNSSGYKGVSFCKIRNKWRATIYINSRQQIIGYSDDKKEAALMYDNKALELHGDFAKTNKMMGLL